MPRLSNESVTKAQIGSVKRTTRGKTVDSMAISKANKSKSLITQTPTERKSTARPRKAKRRSFENTETDSKSDNSPIMMKQRAVSDSAFLGRPQGEKSFYNSSGLKVEAFDYFHEMLNQCCGSHKLNVLEAASILKQFTPEVIKTVIYVIAENAKNNTSTQLQEGQSQTADADEFPDIEISKITGGAARRRSRGKWQQVPELIQPRLTSPVSNSCSPVSAAVQALMSFARPDAEEKALSSSADFDAASRGQVEEQRDHEEQAEKTNLNVFDTDSMTAISGSPFLQPMSSMVMLHTEPEKPQSCADVLSSESDQDKPAFISSVRDALTSSTSSCLSPHFPWTQSPTSKISSEKEKTSRNTEKYLPSISSILGPINAPFSELPFSLQTTLPVFGISKAASKITASQSHFPQSPLSQDAGTTGVAAQGVLEHPSSAGNLLFASSNINLKNQNLPKTVFRAILPKPIDKQSAGSLGSGDQIIKVENKLKIADKMLNLLGIDPSSEQSRTQHFGQAMSSDDHITAMAQCIPPDMLSSLTAKSVLLAPLAKQEPFDTDHQAILPKPLYSVMSTSRERGLNTKGIAPNRATSAVGTKGKKSSTSGNNSGNLEVASALLSMGSTESKGKKSAKVVSSFNREKATFEIEESSQAQRSNILFTATGTFQIEDIEIDPKKNKIEKDSYECGKCGRVFTSLVYLARHIKRVCPDMSLRKWKCDRCEKAFRHPFGLQQHIYTHTGERPYKCDQCSKAFYSANDLRRHKRTHSGERPYSCSHCKKAFSTTISLKTHTYIHTGERPHKCPHCPKTFATSSKLSRHVVTHSDKRPFSCDICVKTFNRSGDLRRHYNNVHNMEHGLLGCDQCNKLFATQKCLQIHKATHNRIGREKSSLDVRMMSEASDVASISELIPGNYTLKASLDD